VEGNCLKLTLDLKNVFTEKYRFKLKSVYNNTYIISVVFVSNRHYYYIYIIHILLFLSILILILTWFEKFAMRLNESSPDKSLYSVVCQTNYLLSWLIPVNTSVCKALTVWLTTICKIKYLIQVLASLKSHIFKCSRW
jgi:hypothetical protein